MSLAYHICGGRIVDPARGRDEVADLYIADGRIVPSLDPNAEVVAVDAAGLTVVPGLIDLHVHLREPGNGGAETIASGSASAARGGFTTIVPMPNTTPPLDTPQSVAWQIAEGRRVGLTRVLPSACITIGRRGEALADLAALAEAGAVVFTDDGATVPDEELMGQALRAARELGRPVMDHALDSTLAGDGVIHDGKRARNLGLPGIPSEAETSIVARDIRLAEETGGAMHIQHMSAREAVDLLRQARSRGVPVSGEVTPHHLALCDADIPEGDANFKMNPPVRDAADREALCAAVAEGVIQAFATDHAPHLAAQKARGMRNAPFGVLGMETAVGVTYTTLVRSGAMNLREWVERWTVGPAAVLGQSPPDLAPGAPADVALLDLENAWTVNPEEFLSMSRNTPFKGWSLIGRVAMTICGGRTTWDSRHAGH